jgi:hypothetical protein
MEKALLSLFAPALAGVISPRPTPEKPMIAAPSPAPQTSSQSQHATHRPTETPPHTEQSTTQVTADKSTTVNVSVQPVFNNIIQSSNTADIHPETEISNNATINSTISIENSVQAKIKGWFSNTFEPHLESIRAQGYGDQAKQFFLAHKKECLIGAAIGMYASCSLHLWWTARWLTQSQRWGMWKRRLSLDELHHYSQKTLESDLMTEIQRRYLNSKNPTDRITPLVQFIRDVDHEAAKSHRYLHLIDIISRSYLTRFFPITRKTIKQIKENKQRLRFIKHIFISWAAQYNFEKM